MHRPKNDEEPYLKILHSNMLSSSQLAAIAKSVGKKPITDLESIGLRDIKPSDIGKAIHVKVYRKWTVTAIRGARQSTLSVILLDQQGGAIQANVESRERNRFDNTLQINGTYTITGFGFLDKKRWMQTLPNRLTLGRFTDITLHVCCSLEMFAMLETQPKERWHGEISYFRTCKPRRSDSLWNEKTRSFDVDEYENAAKPTIMAVSSCWVKTYGGLQLSSTPATCYYHNPDIPETDYMLSMYDQLLTPPVIQKCAAIPI